MNCKHCHEPVKPCPAPPAEPQWWCNGWVHVATSQHACAGKHAGKRAEPESGSQTEGTGHDR